MPANPAPPSPSGSVDRKKEVRKVILSSYVGTTIEYYDFLLYTSAASLVFAKVFFSNAPASVGTILSFVTLLAGYLARPIGGIIFGHFGDRLGRKRMLLITMAIMGVASTLIGVVPSYDTIGVWAPILLVTLRVAQGIAVGGDWGGSATISVEASEEGKRGLTAAFVNMGAPSGAVIATLVLAGFGLMSDEAFLSWGWRIPFLLSAVLVIIGLKIRSSMSESPLFAEMQAKADEQEKKEVPLVAVLKNHWRAVLLAAFGTLAAFALQGLLASYALTLGVSSGGHSRTAVLVAFAVGSVLQIGGLAFYANLSDRYGRRPVMMFGAVLGIVLSFPIFWMIAQGSTLLLFLGMIIGMPLVQSGSTARRRRSSRRCSAPSTGTPAPRSATRPPQLSAAACRRSSQPASPRPAVSRRSRSTSWSPSQSRWSSSGSPRRAPRPTSTNPSGFPARSQWTGSRNTRDVEQQSAAASWA